MKQSIFQLIKSRQSIRTYSKDPIDSTVLDKIQNYIDEVNNPFNKKIHIKIINPDNYHKEKLGTYGKSLELMVL